MRTGVQVILIVFGICALAGACVGGDERNANYAVWTQSSLAKVLKSDPIMPLTPASIRAARNEHEAFQVVLRCGREPLRDVRVTVSDLASGSSGIPASNVSLYLPAYVYLPRLADYYPDPLPPLSRPFSLTPGATQPVWVDVYVPRDAKPGDYHGIIRIEPANGEMREAPFTLHVYGFTLPDDSKLTTAFGLLPDLVANAHGVKPDSPEAKQLHAKYYEFLLARGISTYNIPADLFGEDGAKYLKDPRMTSFVVPYTKDEQEQRRILDRVRSTGAWDKGFFYVVDEPVAEDRYKPLTESCDYLHGIYHDVNIVSPYFCAPSFTKKSVYELLTGYINIWCFNTGFFDAAALDARRKAGDKIWNYVCCGPGRPYANFFVEYTPLEHRMLFWQNYLYQVSGLLYWCTTYWHSASTTDPWVDIATIKDINPGLYGDGSLLYPGSKVGIDGPVSSIRLEVIRDGLDDYKYLWLLEHKSGRSDVAAHVGRLVRSWTEYCHEPAEFDSVRDEIARRIEEPARSLGPVDNARPGVL